MPFDREQIYIQCTGQLGTGGGAGEEIFSFGFHYTGASTSFDAGAVLSALDTEALAALIGVWFGRNTTQINDRAHLFQIKFSALGTDGHVMLGSDPILEEPEPGGTSGFASSPDYPNQIALCVSMRTATNIGTATKGRFYLPLPAIALLGTGRVDPAGPPLVAESTATFFDDMAAELDGAMLLSLMSSVGAGRTLGVTRIEVGDVLDTIRRRRNALQETYFSEDLTL